MILNKRRFEMMAGRGEIVAGSYQWMIGDYKQYEDYRTGQFIQSPNFTIKFHTWRLKLYPRGQKTEDKDTISLTTIEESQVRASFSLTIFNSDGKVLTKKNHGEKITSSCWCVSNMIDGCIIKEPMIFSTDGNFIILCEIRVGFSGVCDKLEDEILDSQSTNRLHQFQKFEYLLNNEEFSDVKFTVEKKQLYAHKVILASGSEVFAAMFKHNMKENAKNVVEIEDISYKVLHELFRFIYTGQATEIIDILQELLVASDKYQVLQLKSICEQKLCENLSINNAINYLNFSNIHGAPSLKKSAVSFVVQYIDNIIDLKEFDSFMNLDVSVVKDIFREFSYNNKTLLDRLETRVKNYEWGSIRTPELAEELSEPAEDEAEDVDDDDIMSRIM